MVPFIRTNAIHLTLSWIFPRKLKERVAKAGAKLVRQRVNPADKAPVIKQVKGLDEHGQELPTADTYEAGHCIRITPSECLVRIPDDLTGKCKLRIVSRHPAKTGELV